MNNDNKFFLELKENKKAEWIVSFLEKLEKLWNNVVLCEMNMSSYLQDIENIEMLTYEAWRHYCEKDKAKFFAMKNKPETPKIGVGVVLKNSEGKILLLLRQGAHGAGTWSLPGGHMELGENFFNVCQREVKEETGINIVSVNQIGFTNDIFEEEGLHYVTLFFEGFCREEMQNPVNMEPDKAKDMRWFTLEEISKLENIFSPLLIMLESNKI